MRNCLSEQVFFTHKELLDMLDPYRQVIWRDKKNEARKHDYYGILSNQAQMSGRDGEMLYYAEKFDKLEQESKHRRSLTALSIIAIYYEGQRSNEKIKALYEKEKGYLRGIPVIADKEKLDKYDLVQAITLLEQSARALYELNDTLSGKEAERILEAIAALAKAKYKDDLNVMARIAVAQILSFYRRAVAENNAPLMREAFQCLDAMLSDKNTLEYMKPYLYRTIADLKTAYYIHYADIDSASFYLGRYEEMVKDDPNLYSVFVSRKYKARLLYTEGKYKESADTYEKAMNALDTSRTLLVRDIDDMMYARAQSEEQQILLADAAARNKEAEKRLFAASALIALLLIAGWFIIRYIRRRQKNRLMEFKLNMARNIHDETNPALLYAKALIKASRSENGNGELVTAELDSHIGHTMALIRSLSHDLKSDKQYILYDLVAKTEQTLKKLNTGNEFAISIRSGIDKKRFISHYQFSQLMSVLNECITNTIKHASFDKINLTFANNGNKLAITYSDNGKGWERHAGAGIGMRNMEERIAQLNGEWEIDNDYPNGYRIHISCLLR
ncbi:sensor histidine kinase [Taibaiella helva]|uniref:sensor histidine kinase n=1 Tax=Taibaiella helva TaxID=2301235 RepID=UPI001300BD41|nr:ATP-binding protein [Taibaiella helva]